MQCQDRRRPQRPLFQPAVSLVRRAGLPLGRAGGARLSGEKAAAPERAAAFVTEACLDVRLQPGVVVLDYEDVVASLIDDLLAEVTLAKMESPMTIRPLTGRMPSNSRAALCSLVLASTRTWSSTASTSGA